MTILINRRGALALSGGRSDWRTFMPGRGARAARRRAIVVMQSEAPRSMDPADPRDLIPPRSWSRCMRA